MTPEQQAQLDKAITDLRDSAKSVGWWEATDAEAGGPFSSSQFAFARAKAAGAEGVLRRTIEGLVG